MNFGIFRRRPTTVLSSEVIRRDQQGKQRRRDELVAARQALAHDELRGDSGATAKRAQLEQQITALDKEIHTLGDALPTALERERRAELEEQARLIADLREVLAEREGTRDTMLTTLQAAAIPTPEEMHALWMVGRECTVLGYAIESATGEPFKSLDALASLRAAMHDRHIEFERRWMRTRPTGKPNFADRPWRPMVERLRALRQPA